MAFPTDIPLPDGRLLGEGADDGKVVADSAIAAIGAEVILFFSNQVLKIIFYL
jgi:hypothetical protein